MQLELEKAIKIIVFKQIQETKRHTLNFSVQTIYWYEEMSY